METVEDDQSEQELRNLIELHRKFTGSPIADQVLTAWGRTLGQFIKVVPTDYRRALELMDKEELAVLGEQR